MLVNGSLFKEQELPNPFLDQTQTLVELFPLSVIMGIIPMVLSVSWHCEKMFYCSIILMMC